MQVPIRIVYRNVKKTESLESIIRKKAAKLEECHSRIISCKVAVERPNKFVETGAPYRVRIDITIPPGHELVIKKEPSSSKNQKDIHTIVSEAFDAAWRSLRKLKEKQSRRVKKRLWRDVGEPEAEM